MKKTHKGEAGYLKAEKKKLLLQTSIEFAIVIIFLIIGYVKTGTKLNMYTLVSVLGCLPASKALVEYITLFPHKPTELRFVNELSNCAPLVMAAYDMVITSKDHVMPLDAVLVSGHTVCGYTSSKKTKPEILEAHIKTMLEGNGYDKMTVKIFTEETPFFQRAESLQRLLESKEHQNGKREQTIRSLILSISM